MINGRRVILTTGSMNRLAPLRLSLQTWLALEEVDIFIIVDWGSDEPLHETLSDVKDPRLLIVRVEDEKFWCNSKCHNLEFRLASNAGILFRTDNDILVQKNFFSKHPLDHRSFYAGNWRTVPKKMDDKRSLTGTLLIDPKYLWVVNGYNERLRLYGAEDDELYVRLAGTGLQRKNLDLETLDHIPHDDQSRYANLPIANPDEIHRSDLIAWSEKTTKEQPWTIFDRMTGWSVIRKDTNYWICRAEAPLEKQP